MHTLWLASGTPVFSGSEKPVTSCARVEGAASTKAASRHNTKRTFAPIIIIRRPKLQKQD
ncbi:hypothetical protein IG631_22152 [Alternaria alternata]|nr:hypothetical protein IG631_22152 [Alternaria alternata]